MGDCCGYVPWPHLHIPSDQAGPRCCGPGGGRTANETRVGNRGVDSDGLLEEAVEEQTPMASRTAVESKGELVKVVRQMRSVWPALVRPKQPSFQKRGDTMDPWQQGVGGLSTALDHLALVDVSRSEERRVGKECRSRWSPDHYKKKSN